MFSRQQISLSASTLRRVVQHFCLMASLAVAMNVATNAYACPMCKIAHEDALDPAVAARPRAYMYSILFMLAMPAGLATTFGVTFYRLSKQQNAINEAILNSSESDASNSAK